ncbi:hypothetical protein ACT453_30235, partial [Bacillus sp. D-CC]
GLISNFAKTECLINPTKNGRYEAAITKDKHKGMVVIQNLAGKNKYDIDQTGDIPLCLSFVIAAS